MSKAPKTFIIYSHNDKKEKEELKTRLAVMENNGEIELWDDNEILPGDKWYKDIADNLADSDILLYLVSAASLASKNCNKELAGALKANTRVIPIVLEACDWENHKLSALEVLPDKGKAVNEWIPESKGWQNVVEGIRKVVGQIRVKPTPEFRNGALCKWVFQQGNFLMMLGQIDKATEVYSHAIQLNPDDATAYSNRGVAYCSKEEYDRAIEDFIRAIEINPNDPEAYFNRGVAFSNRGCHDRAILDYSKTIELDSGHVNAYNNRGAAYSNSGDYDRAILDYNRAIELKPEAAHVYNNRGVTFGKKGEINDLRRLRPAVVCAIKDYNSAIGLNPEFAQAYYNRGEAWLRLGECEKAKSDLMVAREKGIDLVTAFRGEYESVPMFEERNGVKLPENIAEMLTLPDV